MADIAEYEPLSDFRNLLISAFEDAREWMRDRDEWEDELIDTIQLTGAVEYGPWGEGTAQPGHDPLAFMVFIQPEDGAIYQEHMSEVNFTEDLIDFFSHIEDALRQTWEPPEELGDVFTGTTFMARPTSNRDESLQIILIQREPNRGVDIFNEEVLTVEGDTIRRQQIVTETPEVEPDESDTPEDILQFQYRDELENAIITAFSDAIDSLEGQEDSSVEYSLFFVNSIAITGEWGNGTAEHGQTPLRIVINAGLDQPSGPSQLSTFSEGYLRDIAEEMEEVIEPFHAMAEWFSGYTIQAIEERLFNVNITRQITTSDMERAYNLTDNTLYSVDDGELLEVPVEYEPPEPEEGPEEPEIPPEELERQRLAEAFPDIPEELRGYAESPDKLEIKAGKETKAVEPRDIYEFEMEMATQGNAETSIPRDIMAGIGGSMARGRFGREDPPSSFPRTGQYIKYHLLYQGPSYILEIYNDMVVYSGYISNMYDGLFRCGKYDSFREYVYRLEQVEKRGGERLIRPIPDDEAQSRELSTMPQMPVGDGETIDAPWLERRQYFEVNEENLDHPAWSNVTSWLYESDSA